MINKKQNIKTLTLGVVNGSDNENLANEYIVKLKIPEQQIVLSCSVSFRNLYYSINIFHSRSVGWVRSIYKKFAKTIDKFRIYK